MPEDPYLSAELERYFPAPLPERFGEQMRAHRLGRQIVTTQVVNNMLHGGGTTFAFRLHEETGAPASQIAALRVRARSSRCGRWRRSSASTTSAPPRCRSTCCSRAAAVERASALAARQPAAPARHRLDGAALPPGAMVLYASITRLLSPRTRSRSRARRRAARAGRARGPRDARGGAADHVLGARHRRRGGRAGARRGAGGGGALPPRRPARPPLAARPDRGPCRATTAGAPAPARPCATTSTRSTARSPRRCSARPTPTPSRRAWWMAGSTPTRPPSARFRRSATSGAGRATTWTTLPVAVRELRNLIAHR